MVCELAAPAPCPADVVTLTDGSRLVGVVERIGGGKLILTTEFAGTLEIEAAKLVSLQTEQTVHVELPSGDRLVGTVEWIPDISEVVVHTAMGGISIHMDQVDSVWQEGGKSPDVLAMEDEIARMKEQAEIRAGKWSATLEAGINYKDGNTETTEARGRAELRRTSDVDLLRFYIAGDYGEADKVRNTAEVRGGAYYEHLIGERFFLYGSTEAEYDEFENLDLRFTVAAGPGYYWIKEPNHELKTRAGLGYQHESFMNGVTTDEAIMDIGLNYRVDITPWLQFVHATTWYPTFDSIRNYRLVSDSGVLIPLGDSDVWKLKLGALYEYKSIPPAGTERLDQTYYSNIVVELK